MSAKAKIAKLPQCQHKDGEKEKEKETREQDKSKKEKQKKADKQKDKQEAQKKKAKLEKEKKEREKKEGEKKEAEKRELEKKEQNRKEKEKKEKEKQEEITPTIPRTIIEVEESDEEEEDDVHPEAHATKKPIDDEGSDEVERPGVDADEEQSMRFKITPIPAISPAEQAKTLKRPAEVPAESSSIKKGKAAQPKQVCWYNYLFTSFRPRLLLSKMHLKKKRDLSLRQSQLQSGERRYIHSFSCSFREIAMMRRRSRVLKSKEDPLVPYRYLAPEGN